MKTSNIWLGSSLIAFILVMTAANLILYRQFRTGHISTFQHEQEMQRSHFKLPPIHYLIVEGATWVNIIPAESNGIQVPAASSEMDYQVPVLFGPKISQILETGTLFQMRGDTLYIHGSIDRPLHRPFADWYYRMSVEQIYVYASALEHIQVNNGQILLRGSPYPVTGKSLELKAQRSTVWLGEIDDRSEGVAQRRKLPEEHFDTVRLELSNSILLLNKPAVIADLQARLDNASELNDRNAKLDRQHISTSPDSRVSFTGANLSKTIITTE